MGAEALGGKIKTRNIIQEHKEKRRTESKASKETEYEKALAITLIKLKNGVKFRFEDQDVINPPTTIVEKIAKGICWNEKLAMEESDMSYKSAITNLNAVQSELNALQSLHKYLQ